MEFALLTQLNNFFFFFKSLAATYGRASISLAFLKIVDTKDSHDDVKPLLHRDR